jgi:hypothetical protein
MSLNTVPEIDRSVELYTGLSYLYAVAFCWLLQEPHLKLANLVLANSPNVLSFFIRHQTQTRLATSNKLICLINSVLKALSIIKGPMLHIMYKIYLALPSKIVRFIFSKHNGLAPHRI